MTTNETLYYRHFIPYTGASLPLKLITPLEYNDLGRQITYFRGYHNTNEQLVRVKKVD